MTGWPKVAVGLVVGLSMCTPAALAVTPQKLDGSIAGYVRDSAGIPQMGATVLLFNRFDHLLQKAMTNERGIFGFASLPPDFYSIRVNLASFVPAVRQKIAVQPGMQSLLYVDLASVLSSIELVYAAPGQGALMSEDWKWTLKSAMSTRPILRALPELSASDPTRRDRPVNSVFSDTRGVLRVSAGDAGSLGGTYSQTDLGTAFALATSVFGRNQFQVSGNVGYSAHAGTPAAGFRTSFSREGSGPEVALTIQQIYLPERSGLAIVTGQPDGAPALRTMSLALHDRINISDDIRFDYGASLESVSFLDHLNYLSKFGRLSYNLGNKGTLLLGYSSGTPPVQLFTERHEADNPLRNDDALGDELAALSLLPRLALMDGRTTVQRSENFELGYEKRFSSTKLNLTVYRESVTNAAMTIVAPDDLFASGDVLPDISSKSSILNAGSYQRNGFAASVSQKVGDNLEFGSSFGRGGALALAQQVNPVLSTDDLRSKLHTADRFWASARASAKLPVTGTQISGSYQWTDYSALMPNHFYMTQNPVPDAGLNIRVRQPIPSFLGMPGRLEATAELRNMMAQGYLSVQENSGSRVLLMQAPRAVRGGLSFIF